MQFNYQGKIYEFDSIECYDKTAKVKLPDGTILQVNGWFETWPPIPAGFTVDNYLEGQEPEATTAIEICI